MAVFFNKAKDELIVNCNCGCEDTVHLRIDTNDYDYYAIWTYLNGNFYTDQNATVFKTIGKKLKKIWAIIRNKDYYYSDVVMNRAEFMELVDFINSAAPKKENES